MENVYQNSSNNNGEGVISNNIANDNSVRLSAAPLSEMKQEDDCKERMARVEQHVNELKKIIVQDRKFDWKLLLRITSIAVIFFAVCVVLNKTLNFGLSDASVVLAFVGIIATFVVVNNYMQMKDIERKIFNEINEKMSMLEKIKIDYSNINTKLNYKEDKINMLFRLLSALSLMTDNAHKLFGIPIYKENLPDIEKTRQDIEKCNRELCNYYYANKSTFSKEFQTTFTKLQEYFDVVLQKHWSICFGLSMGLDWRNNPEKEKEMDDLRDYVRKEFNVQVPILLQKLREIISY